MPEAAAVWLLLFSHTSGMPTRMHRPCPVCVAMVQHHVLREDMGALVSPDTGPNVLAALYGTGVSARPVHEKGGLWPPKEHPSAQ